MIALLLMQLAGLAQASPTKPDVQPDIIVAGKRLAEAHAECLDGKCTPAQDAKVTIAFAEQRLREGEYLAAKAMLAKAVTRNRRFEKTFPRSLAALYDAYGTVAFHEGDTETFRQAASNQVGVLRRNLPATDMDVVYATIIVGDMWMTLRNFKAADMEYRAAQAQSARQGQEVAALVASLRRVSVRLATGRLKDAGRMLAGIESNPKAADPTIQKGVKLARVRLGARLAKDGEADRLVAEVTQEPGDEPLLLRAGAFPSSEATLRKENGRRFLQSSPVDLLSSPITWADVGFRIGADGRAADVTVLRGTASSSQTQSVVTQISGRRYALQPGGTGQTRLERYTFRGEYSAPINSRIRRRRGAPDMTILDLSEFPAPKDPSTKVP